MTPVFTALGFEVFYLFYGLFALFSQYVNIYKTVGITVSSEMKFSDRLIL